jgi:hypothetical protein
MLDGATRVRSAGLGGTNSQFAQLTHNRDRARSGDTDRYSYAGEIAPAVPARFQVVEREVTGISDSPSDSEAPREAMLLPKSWVIVSRARSFRPGDLPVAWLGSHAWILAQVGAELLRRWGRVLPCQARARNW